MSKFASIQLDQIWQKNIDPHKMKMRILMMLFLNAWFKEDSSLYDIDSELATIIVPFKINKQIMMESIDLIQEKIISGFGSASILSNIIKK